MAQEKLVKTVLKAHLVAVMLVALSAGSTRAETYRWTDEAGVVHFSDSLDKIPARYQRKAVVDDDMSRVTIVPAAKAPEPAATESGADGKTGLSASTAESGAKKPKGGKNGGHAKYAKRGHKKPKQAANTSPVAVTPARAAQNQAEEQVRKDRQALDSAGAPARRAQDQAEEQIRKSRDGMAGH